MLLKKKGFSENITLYVNYGRLQIENGKNGMSIFKEMYMKLKMVKM